MLTNGSGSTYDIDLDRLSLRISRERDKPAQRAVRRSSTAINLHNITGFGPMARITTSFGEVYAQALREGDMVRTTKGQFARILRVDRIRLDAGFVARHPGVQPIKLRKNSIAPGLPAADILVAPYQPLRPGPARTTTPMASAITLLDRPFVERATESQIIYTNISVGQAATIYCEGLAADI